MSNHKTRFTRSFDDGSGNAPRSTCLFRAKLKHSRSQSVSHSAAARHSFILSLYLFLSKLHMEEARQLIGAGQKLLVVGKPLEAVTALQEACAQLAKKYGDTADECGEAFFWCGKALLDVARMENSVLGNALEGVPEEDEPEDEPKDSNVEGTEKVDEKTRDELRAQVYDAMAEKKKEDAEEGKDEKTEADGRQGKAEKADEEDAGEAGEEKSKTEEKTDQEPAEKEEERPAEVKTVDEQEGSTPKEEESTPKEEESTPKEEESTPKEEAAGDGEEAADEQEEEAGGEEEDGDAEMEADVADATSEKSQDSEDEGVGNLQLAWEMLELAKVIYKRKDSKEDQLMAAQAHLKLGEVSLESGNYTQALEDFQACLALQVTHLPPDSRLLAETHYQLGMTYGLTHRYGQTVTELSSSISVITSRLERLQETLDKADGPDALPDERKEMEELKALLPEIQEKVEDARESLKSLSKAVERSNSESGVNSEDSSSSSAIPSTLTSKAAGTVPVSDISHLVRKKRKPEESPVKAGDAKKVKQDGPGPGANGLHKANGDSNGLAENMETEK
ncbi:histone-binding protein N1/N2-like [Cololabis saira]|uniref:histone-binding protein N1/N2-like n=1 Tax=Cololabis saira TaxID=129043 RepID=UPI002AD479E0|nr:histone-binding protein N1/N2-like [Cololabis saira]